MSTQDRPDPRELSQEVLGQYFANPYVYEHQLDDGGAHVLTVDSIHRQIVLETPDDGTAHDTGLLKNVTIDRIDDDTRCRLTIEVGDLPEVSYSLAFSVYKGLESGQSFGESLEAAVGAFRSAIAKKQKLSDEQVSGLYGELLVLEELIRVRGAEDAMDMWLGSDGEEHDLRLPVVDLEVKTTLAEKRVHVISGVNQLKPREGVPLWLLSLQITRAGQGRGRSLDELCMELIEKAAPHQRALKYKLADSGWSLEDHGLYGTRFDLRNNPRAYLVDEQFPAITEDRLITAIPQAGLVSDVRYRVDVRTLQYGVPDDDLAGFVEGGHSDGIR